MSRLKFVASCRLPTEWGVFALHGFEEESGQEHAALTMGDFSDGLPVLARVHSECLTGDAPMRAVQQAGRGCIAYLRQEGRGIGLINKIRAYRLQDQGMDTVEANLALGLPVDARDFTLAQQIFAHLGIASVRLLTNNPDKVAALQRAGIEIAERVPLHVGENAENTRYLHTKAEKLGHLF